MSKINKLDFLIALYILCLALSELMGGKTFALAQIGAFKLNASVAIFVIPLVFSINDIITEVYGKARARSVIWSGLIMISLMMVFAIITTALPPSTRFLSSEAAYDRVFGQSIRISTASLISFALADFLDVAIFSKIRESLGKSRLWFRNNASNFVAQFFDTAFFLTLAFYSLNQPLGANISFLISLILPYWLLKCLMSIFGTPFVYLGTAWLKVKPKEVIA